MWFSILQGSSLECQRSNCSVAERGSIWYHAWTSQGRRRCFSECWRLPPPTDSSDDSFLQVRFVQRALNDLAKCYILHYLSGLWYLGLMKILGSHGGKDGELKENGVDHVSVICLSSKWTGILQPTWWKKPVVSSTQTLLLKIAGIKGTYSWQQRGC